MFFRNDGAKNGNSEGGTLSSAASRNADGKASRIAAAKAIINLRKDRPEIPGAGIYGEPGWELLLDLYIRQMQNLKTSVSSACTASGAPYGTAYRTLNALCSAGWIARSPDEKDKRRDWVHLRKKAIRRMDAYIDHFLRQTASVSAAEAASSEETQD